MAHRHLKPGKQILERGGESEKFPLLPWFVDTFTENKRPPSVAWVDITESLSWRGHQEVTLHKTTLWMFYSAGGGGG